MGDRFNWFPSSGLGTHLSPKLCFAGGRQREARRTDRAWGIRPSTPTAPLHAKQSFARNGIPKLELGNEFEIRIRAGRVHTIVGTRGAAALPQQDSTPRPLPHPRRGCGYRSRGKPCVHSNGMQRQRP